MFFCLFTCSKPDAQAKSVTSKTYHRDGSIKSQLVYVNGLKNGRYIEYFNNGLIKSEGSYIDDKKNGKWIGYYENGVIEYKRSYFPLHSSL